jgi:hypothetical protein
VPRSLVLHQPELRVLLVQLYFLASRYRNKAVCRWLMPEEHGEVWLPWLSNSGMQSPEALEAVVVEAR